MSLTRGSKVASSGAKKDKREKQDGLASNNSMANDKEEGVSKAGNDKNSDMTIGGELKQISEDIRNLRAEIKAEFQSFKDDLKNELTMELQTFKRQIHEDLGANKLAIMEHGTRLEAVEARVTETEEWSMVVKDILLESLEQQKEMQDALIVLDGKQRENNIRIYGVLEQVEQSIPLPQFMSDLLKA